MKTLTKLYLFSIALGLSLGQLVPAYGQIQRDLPDTTDLHLIDDHEEAFIKLFNGENLNGWEQKNGTAKYEVVDGTIKGTTAEGSPNSFLCTAKDYADFDLRFEVKVDKGLNSGVQIRSLSKPGFKQGRVHGPQVEIESDPGESGYIYSEGTGRGWISPTQTQMNVFKNDGWNSYRVLADGNRIQTWINGKHVEDLDVPKVESDSGFIGLQVHSIKKGKGPFTVQWRNIRIKELDGSESRMTVAHKGTPVIDGKIDDVWKNVPRIVTSRDVEEHNILSKGSVPARADVKCLWDDGHLYCLAVVTDPVVSTGAEDPWQNDSVEFFVDGNMARASSYDDDDVQYRAVANGDVTVSGDTDESNFESKVTKTETGYIVEAKIKMETEFGKKIGFDVQVNNNAGNGQRESTAKWNDPTNETYQDMSGVGTLQMIEGK